MNIDTGAGGDAPVWVPPAPVVAPVAPVAPVYNPVSNPTAAPANPILAPAVTSGPSLQSVIQPAILTDPGYLQQMEWLNQQKAKDDARAEQEAIWWEKDFQLAMAGLSSGGGGGGGDDSAQNALDALAKEKAAHQKGLTAKLIQESLASRGMADSGQTAFDQGELQYDFDSLIKEINLRAEARRSAAAASAAAGSAGRANAVANLMLQKEKHNVQVGWAAEDRQANYVNEKGQLVLKTGERLAQAWWDPDTSEYVGPGAERWDRYGRPITGGSSSGGGSSGGSAAAQDYGVAPAESWSVYNISKIKNDF